MIPAIPKFTAPEYGYRWEAWSAGAIGRIKQIRACSDEEIRLRKIVWRVRSRGTGKFSSWKNRRSIHWESPNERNAFTVPCVSLP